MYWEKEIPPLCRPLEGNFAFSLRDGVLVCYEYYSPFSKRRKEVTIRPDNATTSLAVSRTYCDKQQVTYFGLDRDWLMSTVQFCGSVSLQCDGHEANVWWKVDGTSYRVDCKVGYLPA